MKGIETRPGLGHGPYQTRSDHCPAMKGIETLVGGRGQLLAKLRSDHCPAMKGIETSFSARSRSRASDEATTAPQ